MKKTSIFNFSNIYIFLWLVYSLQTYVFGRAGTIYSQAILLFLLGVSIYYFIYTLNNYKMPSYMKGLCVLVAMFTIYGIILILNPTTYKTISGETVSKYKYLLHIWSSLLPIYPFFVFTRQGKLNATSLKRWVLFFFVSVTLQYYQHYQQQLSEAMLAGSNREEFTNNFGYEFLAMIPLLAFYGKRKIIQYIGLSYTMIFILMSMKRGAILVSVICIIWFLLVSFKHSRSVQKIRVVVFGIIVIIAGYYVIQYLLESSDFFNQRLELTMEGDSSGRDVIYATLVNHYLNETNPLLFLFGNGAYTPLSILGQSAHNDWLELALNQGVFGMLVYLLYWMGFYKSTKKSRYDEELFLAMSLLLISNFIRSFFSMSYGDMSIYATMCLGYCMGRLSNQKNIQGNTST